MAVLAQQAILGHAPTAVRSPPPVAFDTVFRIAAHASAILVLLVLAGIIGSMIYGG